MTSRKATAKSCAKALGGALVMIGKFYKHLRASTFLFAAGAVAMAALPGVAATFTEPMPTVTNLPISDASYPWLSEKFTQRPLGLDKAGFVEEEYLVSGKANVYDWDPDPTKDLIVKSKDNPYTTRILVRRPKDPAKFSGTVVVETMNPARGFDMAIMYGWIAEHILDRGDAWIGVSMPGVAASLKRFDPVRYSKVAFNNPVPEGQRACPAPAGGAPAAGRGGRGGGGGGGGANAAGNPVEQGLRLDALAQIGRWLKSNDASNPLAGKVKYAFLVGHTGGDIGTYVSSVGRQARLDGGKPIYDGHLAHSGSNAGALMNCGRTLAAGDPRSVPGQGTGVPMVIMKTQSDLPFTARADNDAPDDIFRVYEMPAATHADKYLFRYLPLVAQQAKASDRIPVTDQWAFDSNCDVPDIRVNYYPQGYLIGGALDNMELYAKNKTPLPKASRVPMIDRGAEEARPQMDQYGNAMGGVRTPYVDVPVGTYHAQLAGANATCAELGYLEVWPWQKTMSIYGSYDNYRQKVQASIQKLVADRWVSAKNAERIRQELIPSN
jgi:hypothetical protein